MDNLSKITQLVSNPGRSRTRKVSKVHQTQNLRRHWLSGLPKCMVSTWEGGASQLLALSNSVIWIQVCPHSSPCFCHSSTATPKKICPVEATRSFRGSEALHWDFRAQKTDEGGTASSTISPGRELPAPYHFKPVLSSGLEMWGQGHHIGKENPAS